tara:strand:- start:323 stop:517 length:195 start_codon:yes stop_codon:yes gene_type:complete
MDKFDKKEYQRNYYLENREKIRTKSQEYYYLNRYNKRYEEILQEKDAKKPFFKIIKGTFIISFD